MLSETLVTAGPHKSLAERSRVRQDQVPSEEDPPGSHAKSKTQKEKHGPGKGTNA